MARILKIGDRLSKIVDLCPEADIILDIGCDHGYVDCELILENKARMVIASEKSEKCLFKAINLANDINITQYISFRVGDGFEVLTKYDKVDFCVIAGMGGLEIIEILKKKPKKLFDFVLQPMNNVIELRKYLMKNDFKILIDKKVYEDGKYYDVIRVTYGDNDFSDIEIFFGKSNFKRKNLALFHRYLTERRHYLIKLKEEVGGLSYNTQKELDYVEEALSMFIEEDEQNNKAENQVISEQQNQNNENNKQNNDGQPNDQNGDNNG